MNSNSVYSSSNSNPNLRSLKSPGPRRISYTLPLPSKSSAKWFSLPSLDIKRPRRSSPLLIEAPNPPSTHQSKVQFHPSNPYSASRRQQSSTSPSHPKHTLAVTCLAADSSTCISGYGKNGKSPEGILYTGGRDGLVSSWELGLKMRKRKTRNQVNQNNWETSTQDAESIQVDIDGAARGVEGGEEEEEDLDLPLEVRWEVDPSEDRSPKSTFRQCVQTHTDWVNDLLLVNQNQTLISASSDHTVKLWNPHDASSALAPHSLGSHKDYVKCLSHAREAETIASGGFDQVIKLWDIKELRDFPTLTIPSSEVKASVYALSINPSGTVIAAGTPEKVVKVFDPRSGKNISNLIGHTDNIRSVLVSDDGRHLLSASSDSTVRLWSLGEQRCLHTFTHHNSSVWSLTSNDPDLDVFYSGDKDGIICKVDWERCSEVAEGECVVLARDGGPDRDDTDSDSQASYLSNGRGNRGVHKIVALDDSYVWATTGSSDVNRWKDVRPRSERESLYPIGSHVSKTAGTLQQVSSSLQKSKSQPPQTDHSQFSSATDSPTSGTSTPVRSKPSPLHQERVENPRAQLFGIPFDSLVCLSPPNDPYEVGVGSASVMSVNLSFKGGISSVGDSSQLPIPANSWRSPVPGRPSFDQRMSSGNAASPLSAISPSTSGHLRPSSIRSASIKFAPVGLESSSPREDWGMVHDRQSMDVGEPLLAIQDDDDDDLSEDGPAYEARLAYEDRDLAEDAQPLRKYPDETIKGSHGLIRSTMLNDRRHVLTIDTSGKVSLWDIIAGNCLGHFVQQEIQETIEELSKGELDREGNSNAARFTPGEVLELVKERIECEGSTQTWCSIDTRSGALSVHLEEQRIFDCEVYLDECSSIVGTDLMKEDQRVNVGKWVLRQLLDGFVRTEQLLRPGKLAPGQLAIENPQLNTNQSRPLQLEIGNPSTSGNSAEQLSPTQPLHTPGATIGLASPARNAALAPIGSSPLTPSGERGLGSLFGMTSQLSGEAKKEQKDQAPDYFSSKEADSSNSAEPATPSTPSAATGLMGRLRFGLKSPRAEKALAVEKPVEKALEKVDSQNEESPYAASLRELFSKNLSPPSENDAPPIPFSPSISIVVSESSPDASTWEVIYRGLVRTLSLDVAALELCAPLFALDFVLTNNITGMKEMPKLSFVLSPCSTSETEGGAEGQDNFEIMKELPSGNARLTATRLLRMKKVSSYVSEKLGFSVPKSRNNSIAGSRRSSADANALGNAHGSGLSMTALAAKAATEKVNSSLSSSPNGIAPSNASTSSSTSNPISLRSHYVSLMAQGVIQPHECIEILVSGKVLPSDATLAQCQRFWWKTPEDIKLEYRWKRRLDVEMGEEEG